MKKTILHITDSLGLGGAEVLLKNTIPLLPEYEHVIVYLSGSQLIQFESTGLSIYKLDHNGKKDIVRSVLRLRKIIKRHKVELIHSHLFLSTVIARIAKPRGVKLVSTIHSILSKNVFEKKKVFLKIERLTVNRQDALIAVSHHALKDYLSHISFKGQSSVLYNFIPDYFFINKSSPSGVAGKEILKCISVGNLKAVKNYDFTLKAFNHLKESPIELDIYGDGILRKKLQEKIDSQGLKVSLKGSGKEINKVLTEYGIFIQMSLHEGFGLALLEAMAIGLVPVLSDIPVHREVAGDCAFYVNLENEQELSFILQKIQEQKDGYKQRRMKCMARAKEIAGKDGYIEHLRSIYLSLLN